MKRLDFVMKIAFAIMVLNCCSMSALSHDYEFFYNFDNAVADTITGVPSVYGSVNAKVYASANANNNVAIIDVDGNQMASYLSANKLKNDVSFIQTDSLSVNSSNSDATYGMWVKMKDPMDGRPLQILMSTIGARSLLQLRPIAGKWRVETAVNAGAGRFDASLSLEFGQWTHVALVTRVSPASIEVYVDGELAALTPVSTASFDNGFAPFSKVRIGAHNNLDGGFGQTFCGELDEVFMTKSALTAAELKEVMGDTPGQNDANNGGDELVKSSFFYDFTGADLKTGVAAIHGTTSALCIAVDSLDTNLSFIADDNRGTVAYFPKGNNVKDSVAYIQTDGLTSGSYNCDASYGMWINLEDPQDTRPIQTLLTTTGARALLQIRAAAGTWTLETAVNVAPGRFAAADTIPYGQWTHVALVTEKEPASLKMYINGQEVSIQANDGASLVNGFEKFYELRIGAHNNQSDIGCLQSFCGTMDDVFMYSKALSAQQVDSIVKASGPTPIRQVQRAALQLYPNPVVGGDMITISCPEQKMLRVKMYDLTGQCVHSFDTFSDHAVMRIKSPRIKGQYLVSVQADTYVYTQKILVK